MFARALVVGSITALAVGCYTHNWPPDLSAGLGESEGEGDDPTGGSDATGGDPTGGDPSSSDATGGAGSSSAASDSATGDDLEGASAGEPSAPEILDVEVTPEVILENGLITVSVATVLAEGVRMELGSGDLVELAAADEPGRFVGAIPALTGLENGEHAATLTPWAGEEDGEAIVAPYTIALPAPGSQAFWEASGQLGDGIAVALGVLPDGRLVELGQHTLGGAQRCYLRRRDPGGAWAQSDVLGVLPGTACAPLDLKVGPDGSIALLAMRPGKNGQEWWLGVIEAWGAGPKNVGAGSKDEFAGALAIAGDGTIAACGFAPTGLLDQRDATAWIFRPGKAGEARTFDYTGKDQDQKHEFTETIRDCAFAGGTLVMAGEVHGPHETGNQIPLRDRHFLHEYDLLTKQERWRVGGVEGALQSGARALAIDDQGRYLTTGFVCADECQPQAILRVQDPKDDSDHYILLGPLKGFSYGPHDLAWSPAGYAVVAAGGPIGEESAFWVRAFKPGQETPLWAYKRKEAGLFHMARALAIGPFGQVYAAGLGANFFPAVAYLGG